MPGGRCSELDIIVSNASDQPIYEQVASQIRDAILSGELAVGDALPSIRALANDLHVSVITTKRAYTDLESQGFIDTVQGKGSFVAGGSLDMLREDRVRQVETTLAKALREARAVGVTVEELHEMLDALAE